MKSMEEHESMAEERSNLCEECNSMAFKYKCPACSRRTCSLPCVNSHKLRFLCSGKKLTTQFVPLSQFDSSTLLSDFKLLEEVKRVAESSQRWRAKLGGCNQFRLPFHLNALRNAAYMKGTKLMFLPAGMFKRRKNRTRYNQRKQSVYWTIEWRFHSTDVVLLEHGVHECATLRSVIEKHLEPSPWKGKLRKFCDKGLANLKFFIRTHQKGSKAPHRELDLDAQLSQLLSGLAILEYPTIHVYLSSDTYDFEVVKVRPRPIQQESKAPMGAEDPSHVGVVFKEEEIVEEDRAPSPLVIDLLKSSEACPVKPPTPTKDFHTKEKRSQGNNIGGHIPKNDKSIPGREMQMSDDEMEDFDFDEELVGEYSLLVQQSNPDNFLDFKQEGERQDHDLDSLVFPGVEELEEGEIPSD